MFDSKSCVGCLAVVFTAGLISAPAWPQDTASKVDNDASLAEVTVTARKREERLQDTPISMSAFGGAALEERNIQNTTEITNYVPNVQFDSSATESGGASTQIAIRGIGQTDYVLTVEPAVGIYLDGVYVGKSVGALLDTTDLERLEVLRGPQGTLFGRNTMAGAIQMVSKRPRRTPEMEAALTGGSFDRLDARVGVSVPVSDKFRFRLSANRQEREGFMKRLSPITEEEAGHRLGDKHVLSGRLLAELDATDNLLITFAGDFTRQREVGPPTVTLDADENGALAFLFNAGVPGGVCLPTAGPGRLSNPFCFNTQYEQNLDTRTTHAVGPVHTDSDIWGASVTLDWKLRDALLRSISAFRKTELGLEHDITSSPYYRDNLAQDIDSEQVSQEIQLIGDWGAQLHYVLGGFFMRETGSQLFMAHFNAHFNSGGAINNDSYAAFSQLTYDVNERWSVTGGARYTRETKQFNPGVQKILDYSYPGALPIPGWVNVLDGAFGAPGTPIFPAGWYKRQSSAFSPMASVSYKFQPDVLGYASVSRGFKGGGFVMRILPAITVPPGVDPDSLIGYAGPETATQYEIGMKTELLDRRLRLNASAYYIDYEDLQVTLNIDTPQGSPVPTLANAGNERIKGLELESSFRPFTWLTLDGSVGFNKSGYRKLKQIVFENYPNAGSLIPPNAPQWTANVGATTLFFDDSARGRASARVDLSYRDGQFKEFQNAPTLFQPAYKQLSASASYVTPDGQWELTAGGTNLTDKIYRVNGYASFGLGFQSAVASRPREWFARVTYRH